MASADLLLVRFCQFGHARELEIIPGGLARIHCGPKPCLLATTVYPTRRKPHAVRWLMVMEQAFCGVEDIGLSNIHPIKLFEHVFKIAQVRLVRPDLLSRKDCV